MSASKQLVRASGGVGPSPLVVRSLYRALLRNSAKYDRQSWCRGLLTTDPAIRPFVDGLKFFLRTDSVATLIRRVFDDKRRLSPHASVKAVDVGFAVLRVVSKPLYPFGQMEDETDMSGDESAGEEYYAEPETDSVPTATASATTTAAPDSDVIRSVDAITGSTPAAVTTPAATATAATASAASTSTSDDGYEAALAAEDSATTPSLAAHIIASASADDAEAVKRITADLQIRESIERADLEAISHYLMELDSVQAESGYYDVSEERCYDMLLVAFKEENLDLAMIVYDMMRTNYYPTPPALLYCLLRLCASAGRTEARHDEEEMRDHPDDDTALHANGGLRDEFIGQAMMILHGSSEWNVKAEQSRALWALVRNSTTANVQAATTAAAINSAAAATAASSATASAPAVAGSSAAANAPPPISERRVSRRATAERVRIEAALFDQRWMGDSRRTGEPALAPVTTIPSFRKIVDLYRPLMAAGTGASAELQQPPTNAAPSLGVAAQTVINTTAPATAAIAAGAATADNLERAATAPVSAMSYFIPHPASSFRSWIDRYRRGGRYPAANAIPAAAATATAPPTAAAAAATSDDDWSWPVITPLDLIHEVMRVCVARRRKPLPASASTASRQMAAMSLSWLHAFLPKHKLPPAAATAASSASPAADAGASNLDSKSGDATSFGTAALSTNRASPYDAPTIAFELLDLLNELPNCPPPTLRTYELVAQTCRYDARRSALVLQRMKAHNIKPNAEIYSRLVRASETSPEQTFAIYQRMVAARLTPTLIAFRTLVDVAQRTGDSDKLKMVMNHARLQGVDVNEIDPDDSDEPSIEDEEYAASMADAEFDADEESDAAADDSAGDDSDSTPDRK